MHLARTIPFSFIQFQIFSLLTAFLNTKRATKTNLDSKDTEVRIDNKVDATL